MLIIGPGGAGKSTLARRLGKKLGTPVIHLDALYWRPGWTAPPEAEWAAQVDELLARDEWILDGNYSGTFEKRISAAEVVVFLDFPRLRCLYGVYSRWWKTRGRLRDDLAPGCPEYLPKPDFVRWLWNYPRVSRPKLMAALDAAGAGKDIVVLRSREEVERWEARLVAARAR